MFVWLSIVRMLSAQFNPIDDCDETYGYFEPVAHLLFGNGFQTWEYAPQYALRSWWYPASAALLLRPLVPLVTRAQLFFIWRALLGAFCAACETYFFKSALRRFRGGSRWLGMALGLGLLVTPGMFAASTSFLPNSLSMCLYMLCFGSWMRSNLAGAVVWGALAALLGVPFSALMLAFLAVYVIVEKGFLKTAAWATFGAIVALGPQLLVDRVYYGRWTCAVWNIVYYNALSSSTDSTLYGVEPWSFYVKNLLLNLNVFVPLSLLSVPLYLLQALQKKRFSRSKLLILVSPFLWLAFMFWLPHKEQRFLYVVYPLLILNGAVAFSILMQSRWMRPIVALLLIVCLAMSASRITAQTVNRGAPLHIWRALENVTGPAVVCLGNEWHRFPSSFWLPHNGVRAEFIRSDFGGLLPKHFAASTCDFVTGMNDRNREETDRYVPLESCDYFVEESDASFQPGGHIVASLRMVDDARTGTLFRAFAVPIMSAKKTTFKQYQLSKVLH